MKKSNEIILVGAFSEMIELCTSCGYSVVGYIDNQVVSDECGIGTYLGTDNDIVPIFKKYGNIPVVISPDLPKLRKKLFEKYREVGFKFQTVVSPEAHISPSSKIGLGAVIQCGAHVSANSFIGNFVKLNVNANVMHDSVVGDFTTIAPNAVVLGKINIGSLSYIGANATILPYCKIGDNVTVGAGAVVTKDILSNQIAKGVPAQCRAVTLMEES